MGLLSVAIHKKRQDIPLCSEFLGSKGVMRQRDHNGKSGHGQFSGLGFCRREEADDKGALEVWIAVQAGVEFCDDSFSFLRRIRAMFCQGFFFEGGGLGMKETVRYERSKLRVQPRAV